MQKYKYLPHTRINNNSDFDEIIKLNNKYKNKSIHTREPILSSDKL